MHLLSLPPLTPSPRLSLLAVIPCLLLAGSFMADHAAHKADGAHGLCNATSLKMYAVPRQLRVAQEDRFVHDVHGTYPRLCKLADGSILAGYTAFEPDGQRVLSVARTVDNARTFEPHGEVTRSAGDCDNLSLLELPRSAEPEADEDQENPTILAAFRNHDLSPDGQPTYFRITVCRSTDGGRSWSFLSQAYEKPAPLGLWEPFLRATDAGEIQLFFSQEADHDDQDTMLVRSTDGGRTWSSPVCVTGEGEKLRDGMVGVAETLDAATGCPVLVVALETTRRGTFSIEAVMSYDGGESFGSRHVVYEPKDGKNAGAPQIAAFEDGSLAVVFMTDEDGTGEPDWPRGARIKAVHGSIPEDGQIRWGAPEVIGDTASSWPGILRIEDDIALAVFEFSASIRGRALWLDAPELSEELSQEEADEMVRRAGEDSEPQNAGGD